ncbi:hypothetical protein NP233_g11975 [Leucocoprinus birnbaumii]|uniref:Uncharacterized protein n=1 Tax=Leucocoprinus birnbaumii TaxID=56174 RepID=A0AAD5VH56_9AGAR|nr:hypothetical protein NP233_g11975 [Leucocoprinus birnbaumii]
MVGANYMGGRRNAVKARTRDKFGKAQKEFFGRRRLNLLSKGLGVQPRFGFGENIHGGAKSSRSTAARASIDLNHAKKAMSAWEDDAPSSEAMNSTSSGSRKPKRDDVSNLAASSSSPTLSKGSTTATSSASSASVRTKSKLLQQLDLLERELIRV